MLLDRRAARFHIGFFRPYAAAAVQLGSILRSGASNLPVWLRIGRNVHTVYSASG